MNWRLFTLGFALGNALANVAVELWIQYQAERMTRGL